MVGDILQPTHLLFVLVVALLVLGPKRLPEVGRTLGGGLRDFRAAINGETAEHRGEPQPAAPSSIALHPPADSAPQTHAQAAGAPGDADEPQPHPFAYDGDQPADEPQPATEQNA